MGRDTKKNYFKELKITWREMCPYSHICIIFPLSWRVLLVVGYFLDLCGLILYRRYVKPLFLLCKWPLHIWFISCNQQKLQTFLHLLFKMKSGLNAGNPFEMCLSLLFHLVLYFDLACVANRREGGSSLVQSYAHIA